MVFLAVPVLPLVEMLTRRAFRAGIPGATDYIQHTTFWLAFLGAAVASRENRHLKLAAVAERLPAAWRSIAHVASAFATVAVCTALAGASFTLLVAEAPALSPAVARWVPRPLASWLEPFGLFEDGSSPRLANWLPLWIAEAVMPVGFLLMAVRGALQAGRSWRARATAALGALLTVGLAAGASAWAARLIAPLALGLLGAVVLGAPLFVLLGGFAALFFWAAGVPVAAIPSEAYRIVASPFLPTIPLFTLTGYLLSASRASERLVRVFRAWLGWLPGGTAVAVTLLCAFFTTFTGASGVTILALGALLFPVLLASGFPERFALGLLTATGSIGLLLPPSLVVILYGVIAGVPILDLFKAALLPGALLIAPVAGACVIQGARRGAGRTRFQIREAAAALWAAKWELLLPVVVIFALFGGFCSLVEAAALSAAYALAVECFLYRDLPPSRLSRVLEEGGALVGAVLILVGVAMGLSSYFVDAQIPLRATEWVGQYLHSRWVFLLALNGALLIVGCLMDIFSALVVVVPLMLPMAQSFGVHPLHLGVIFLANLALGYLTPPVGMNLFLAAARFDRPVLQIARHSLPFLLLLAIVVLLITYVPWLTLGTCGPPH